MIGVMTGVRHSVTIVEIISRLGMTEEREGYVVTSILFVKTTFVVVTNLSKSRPGLFKSQ